MTIKITGETRPVNPSMPVVRDAASTYDHTVPERDVHARELARQAERWLAFASERSRMTPRILTTKAFDSLAFSVLHGARSYAVPTKLTGTRSHQRRLWALVREGYQPWQRLTLDTTATDGIAVSLDDEPLGAVQPKHVPWARPLVAFGLTVHLAKVTGSERDGYTLGVNVVFGGVGQALDRLLDALGTTGDGQSSDGQSGGVPEVSITEAGGDGAATEATSTEATGLRLVALPAPDPDDVVLWRRVDGTACASVTHLVHHSMTGIEWGYRGSGPSDLALSVLGAVCGLDAAERHYSAFAAEVVSHLPFAGGVLRAANVRAWAAQQEAPHPVA